MTPPRRRAPATALVLVALIAGPGPDGVAAAAAATLECRVVPAPTAAEMARRYTPEQRAMLEMLNRADTAHLANLDSLVVPAAWPADPEAACPVPEALAWARPLPKLLVVHIPWQAFAAYEHGRRVRWGPVSTGRRSTPTPLGLYHLNWRSTGRPSTEDPDWYLPWYFNFHNRRGLSFHQYDLPGRPASHACVRLLERDARWLYGWGGEWTLDERGWEVRTQGTPVWILGRYDYDAPPPWRSAARRAALPVPVPAIP